MIDDRELLEKESQRVAPAPGALERTRARYAKRERNRRISVIALVVCLVVSVAALFTQGFPSSGRTPLSTPTTSVRPSSDVLYGGTLWARDPVTGDGRSILDVGAVPGKGEITSAAWSYDHTWVAFRSGNGSQDGSIWVVDAAGGELRRVAADGRWSPWVWSPTDDQLAVVQGREILLIDPATGHETSLGTTGVNEDWVQAMVWSPDGTRIAYSGGPGLGSVYSVDVKSGEHSVLVPAPGVEARVIDIDWSPDGAHLAITYEDTVRPVGGDFPRKLYLANADGSGDRLVDSDVATGSWPDWHPGLSVGTAWSPDGSRLAYASFAGADRREMKVWTVAADDSAPSLVTTQCCAGGDVVWSPDGTRIALVSEKGVDLPLSESRHYMLISPDGTTGPTEIDELRFRSWAGGWYFCFCYG